MGKTTTLHVHQAFFVHFLAVPAQLRLEMTKSVQIYLRTEKTRRFILPSLSELGRGPSLNSNINSPLLSNRVLLFRMIAK